MPSGSHQSVSYCVTTQTLRAATSKLRVEAGGGSRLQCFMCVFYGSLSVRQHALAAESRFLKAD